nr:DUF4342 domain-containing protein [uncultured Peptostreptococcus sp.]
MEQITIEMVDQVLERLPHITYKEAREALIKTGGNVLEAVIYIESGNCDGIFENKRDSIRRFGESISQESEKIRCQLIDLLKKTSFVRVVIKKESTTILNIPLTIGIVGVAAMPILSILGLSAAVLNKYSLIIRDDTSGETVDVGNLTPEKLELLKEMLFNSFDDIKETFKKSTHKTKDYTSEDIIYELLEED